MFLSTSEIIPEIFQPVFEAALKTRVGKGRPLSYFELGEAIGTTARTVEGWLLDGRLPSFIMLWRLVHHFNKLEGAPHFLNELLEHIDLISVGAGNKSSMQVDRGERFVQSVLGTQKND